MKLNIPLTKAVTSGFTPAVELLLLNGAKVNACDFRGRTALHHATIRKDLKLVCLLLKRGADPLCVDKNNEDPIQIATENCQANIVTILRVAKMNNDLKEQDFAYSGDPMFSEILRDLLRFNDTEHENGRVDSEHLQL
jgi:Arf-GAP/coiled-coil/ANK repeat/PH domain-containing protein